MIESRWPSAAGLAAAVAVTLSACAGGCESKSNTAAGGGGIMASATKGFMVNAASMIQIEVLDANVAMRWQVLSLLLNQMGASDPNLSANTMLGTLDYTVQLAASSCVVSFSIAYPLGPDGPMVTFVNRFVGAETSYDVPHARKRAIEALAELVRDAIGPGQPLESRVRLVFPATPPPPPFAPVPGPGTQHG